MTLYLDIHGINHFKIADKSVNYKIYIVICDLDTFPKNRCKIFATNIFSKILLSKILFNQNSNE